jgi:hypothetical protein
MPIKFLKASSYYPNYLEWFYNKHPHLRHASYAEQHAALMYDSFALSDTWKRNLEATGQFLVEELVVNAEILQKRWAQEHGCKYSEKSWMRDIFFAQFSAFNPRVLYAHGHDAGRELKDELKAKFGSGLFVLCYDGVMHYDRGVAQNCDLMLTCVERAVGFYEAAGIRTHLMPWGFDADILARLNKLPTATEVSFIGGISFGNSQQRIASLAALAKNVPASYWLSNLPSRRTMVAALGWWIMHGNLKAVRRFIPLSRDVLCLSEKNHGTLYGREMLAVLAASKMTLNIHSDRSEDQAGNIRLYEATGTGSCLVTDWKSNLGKSFEPDREVVTFRSPEEAAEKILFLLAHETERKAIAERGHLRTLKSHCFGDRIREVGNILREVL